VTFTEEQRRAGMFLVGTNVFLTIPGAPFFMGENLIVVG
jgi:hypothetical protein